MQKGKMTTTPKGIMKSTIVTEIPVYGKFAAATTGVGWRRKEFNWGESYGEIMGAAFNLFLVKYN